MQINIHCNHSIQEYQFIKLREWENVLDVIYQNHLDIVFYSPTNVLQLL